MDGIEDFSMPVGFAMALATDKDSLKAFLALDDGEQLRLLQRARECETQRERQLLAMNIARIKK